MTSGDSAPEPSSRASVIPLLPVWRVDRTFDYLVPNELAARLRVGHLVRVPFGNRNVRGIVVALASGGSKPERELAPIISIVIEAPLASPALIRLIEWLAHRYAVARGVAFARLVPPRVRVRIGEPTPLQMVADAEGAPPLLGSYDGAGALLDAIAGGGAGTWSLRTLPAHDHGEIIAELVAAVSTTRGAALVAVPEVRYGSEVLERLDGRCPQLARIDSARDEAERARGWIALAAGHRLGAGGRSSVLAPAPELRLIVLDEEHHYSFKEDRSPRYDARRVAVERARLQDAVCVLISSTPPLETGLAVRRGAAHEIAAPRRLQRAARPIVEVVQPARERALTSEMHDRIRDTLRVGRRVGLLAAARGYARAVWCASCRRSLRCPRCEAGMFYDRTTRQGARVRCVRCAFESSAPSTCPTCGATNWRYLGAGSERLAEQIARAFPRARVGRMDPDILATDGAASAEPDIYVTTWIGTKPALRPDVALVGVLDADALIRRPDFRAAEHAYHALTAMSEWAGPASAGGRLLIQCSEPGHHAVQAVVRADHDYFVARELELRQELSYPPFTELVKATASGSRAGELIAEAASAARSAGGTILGPLTTPSGAREILVKCEDATAVGAALRGVVAAAPAGDLKVDADPR